MRFYLMLIPDRLREHSMTIGFFVLWFYLGMELWLYRFREILWPKYIDPNQDPHVIRYVLAGIMMLSAIMMIVGFLVAGACKWAAMTYWLGALTAGGVCLGFLWGVIRLIYTHEFLYPQVIAASVFWVTMACLIGLAIIDGWNKRTFFKRALRAG